MNKKEINQIWVMKKLKDKEITQKKAGEILELSERQIRRKLKNYIKEGGIGLIHKNVGMPSNNKTKPEIAEKIIFLSKTVYEDFGPTLLAEKLEENHDIKIDHETVRRILISVNLHNPRKKKVVRRVRREPKHHPGELVQLDGSFHVWFCGEYSTLIVFIDDATKEVFCHFAPESFEGVSNAFKLYLKKYGRPLCLYTDKGRVFKVNKGRNKNDALTQFKRATNELDIKIKFANSPQAKGRVERVNRTLQDRLVKELKLMNINSIDQANAMLNNFLQKFNKKFTVYPKNPTPLFRSIERYDLNSILCYKFKRKLNNDYTISFKNKIYQLDKKQKLMLYPRDTIEVFVNFDKTISLWKDENRLNFKEIEKTIKNFEIKREMSLIDELIKENNRRHICKPDSTHPWKNTMVYKK